MLYAGTQGYLDSIPVDQVKRYEADLLDYVRSRHDGLLAGIRDTGELDEDALRAALQAFTDEFAALVASETAEAEAQAEVAAAAAEAGE